SATSDCHGDGSRRGDAELLVERLQEFVQLEHRHVLEDVEQLGRAHGCHRGHSSTSASGSCVGSAASTAGAAVWFSLSGSASPASIRWSIRALTPYAMFRVNAWNRPAALTIGAWKPPANRASSWSRGGTSARASISPLDSSRGP